MRNAVTREAIGNNIGGETHSSELPKELTAKERAELRKVIDSDGETAVRARTGLSREALARVVAGLGVRRGTIALARLALKASP